MKNQLIFCLLLVMAISGCATNPMTGRSQLILVSEAAAINKSSQLYSSMMESHEKKSELNSDPAVNERVRSITNRLVERAVLYRPDSQKWQWQVNVIESEDINAFCMAGGKMAIYTGLLNKINPTDDELAQVMGHEIAHALANHTAEKMSVDILAKIAIATVTVAAAASDKNASQAQRNRNQRAVQDTAALAGAAFVTLPNSRGAEAEADKLGIELAAQAGFNPEASITLWEKMIAVTGDKERGDFMKTHPSSPKRIEAFQTLMDPMKKVYKERLPLYANYQPSHQYVRASKDSAGFKSSNVRVLEDGASSLAEVPNGVDPSQAMAFYSKEYEDFKQGLTILGCHSCSLKFYVNQADVKKLHEAQDWRGLAQKVIKVGYHFDLSYYYLGAAAKGLGLNDSAKKYFIQAKKLSSVADSTCSTAKLIKCNDIDIASVVIEETK